MLMYSISIQTVIHEVSKATGTASVKQILFADNSSVGVY